MNKSIEQVKEFHETFSHLVGDISKVEPLATRQLRIKLLFEELAELAEASDCTMTMAKLSCSYLEDLGAKLGPLPITEKLITTDKVITDGDNVNQIEELDALCDIQYVLNGKILTAGMHEIFDKNFDLVHQNNMSKAHDNYEEALKTKSSLGLTSYNILPKENGKFVLVNSAGKIIKPHNHEKVLLTLK